MYGIVCIFDLKKDIPIYIFHEVSPFEQSLYLHLSFIVPYSLNWSFKAQQKYTIRRISVSKDVCILLLGHARHFETPIGFECQCR